MKPRKKDETDAEYIARLETSLRGLKATNDRFRKDHARIYKSLIPSAQVAGMVCAAAAEVCGVTDDPEVSVAIQKLEALGSACWNDDEVTLDRTIDWPKPVKEYGGDAEMVLKSALEKVKRSVPPWESRPELFPHVPTPDLDKMNWRELHHEVCDALSDLDFGRGVLRLDARSTMYDHCFQRLVAALNEAAGRQEKQAETERPYDDAGPSIPF